MELYFKDGAGLALVSIPGSRTLRILEWNAGTGCASAGDMIKLVSNVDAGIVGIVEVGGDFEATIIKDADACAKYPNRYFYGEGLLRKAILSKYPILEARPARLEDSRFWVESTIRMDNVNIHLYLVHASPWIAIFGRYAADGRSVVEIARRAREQTHAIVLGDFNSTERSSVWSRMRSAGFVNYRTRLAPMRDLELAESGGLSTFPIFGRYHGIPLPPMVRIDSIWTRGFGVARYAVAPDGGSDHLPVFAELSIP